MQILPFLIGDAYVHKTKWQHKNDGNDLKENILIMAKTTQQSKQINWA